MCLKTPGLFFFCFLQITLHFEIRNEFETENVTHFFVVCWFITDKLSFIYTYIATDCDVSRLKHLHFIDQLCSKRNSNFIENEKQTHTINESCAFQFELQWQCDICVPHRIAISLWIYIWCLVFKLWPHSPHYIVSSS